MRLIKDKEKETIPLRTSRRRTCKQAAHSNSQVSNSIDPSIGCILDENVKSYKRERNTFKDTPKTWLSVIKINNPETTRNHLFFKCNYPGCESMFKKSCNLRDHFRKHTGIRPFVCNYCNKNFT